MKAHAVPHDIMSVEFKLFGNFLSLREFVYIAVGVVVAYFFYFLMQKGVIPFILAIPAIIVFGLGGPMMALLPIQDRPLDQWLTNYFAAIRRPTQRVWKKHGYNPSQHTDGGTEITIKDHTIAPPVPQQKIFAGGSTKSQQESKETVTIDQNESSELARIEKTLQTIETGAPAAATPQTIASQTAVPQVSAPQTSTAAAAPVPAATKAPTTAPVQQATPVDPKIAIPVPSSGHHTTSSSVTNQPAPTIPQPITVQSSAMTKKTKPQQNTQTNPTVPQPPAQPMNVPPQPIPPQKSIFPKSSKPQGQQKVEDSSTILDINDENLKDYATTVTSLEPRKNTINIVVKDVNGLILPGVVCVIKNTHGDPVRAAISNILGQIINNVPLKDDVYKINLSKQGYTFPEITRTLQGKNYPPIEIKSL